MLSPIRTTALVAAAAVLTTSCAGSSGRSSGANLPAWVDTAAAVARLVTYDSCDDAHKEITKAALDHVGPYGFDGGQAAAYFGTRDGTAPQPAAEDTTAFGNGLPAAPAAPQAEGPAGGAPPAGAGAEGEAKQHSTTNTHEAGVDEPDLVKTDGRRLLTVTDGVLRVVDVASRRLVGELPMSAQSWPDQMLLFGDRALLVGRGGYYLKGGIAMDGPLAPDIARSSMPVSGTQITIVDVSGRPDVVSTVTVAADYVDARQVGSMVRMVLRSYPTLPFEMPRPGVSDRDATKRNRAIVQDAPLSDWLPNFDQVIGGRVVSGELVGCSAVHHVPGAAAVSMLSVLSLDLAGDGIVRTEDSVAIASSGETVYGTGNSLYVAEGPYGAVVPLFGAAEDAPAGGPRADKQRTRIHKFDVGGAGRPSYVASGSVTGTLLNQYSMSEFDGTLRVATTIEDFSGVCCGAGTASESGVTVLAQSADRLVPVGAVDGLGKGERIYAVRFVGPIGYVVTFRQTDPLYTIDLSDPRRPRVAGELKITGYSAYLHPAGNGKLIGVGQEATREGQTLGTQVSLFDVSNPAWPDRLAAYHLRGGSSEAEWDPHAFLYWPATGTIVIPIQAPYTSVMPDGKNLGGGALVLRLTGSQITELGTIQHPLDGVPGYSSYLADVSIRRAVVIDSSLWTVSSAGVLVTDLNTLHGQAWIPFPWVGPQPWPYPVPVEPPRP